MEYGAAHTDLAPRIHPTLELVLRKEELAGDLRYVYMSLWYFCSASLVGYVIYVHLELKRVPKTDKVRGALACI